MSKQRIRKMALAAMFIALGIVLPFFTTTQELGKMLLPMHLPVMLCGFICGWRYGGIVGLTLPPLRYLLVGMPPIYPTGIGMMVELAVYGAVAGFIYSKSRKRIVDTYIALVVSMLAGRFMYYLTSMALVVQYKSLQVYVKGSIIPSLLGIFLQLLIIPPIVIALDKAGYIKR